MLNEQVSLSSNVLILSRFLLRAIFMHFDQLCYAERNRFFVLDFVLTFNKFCNMGAFQHKKIRPDIT